MPKETKSYIIGFILSVVLTGIAGFLLILQHNSGHALFSHWFLTSVIMITALLQFVVQLIFFLHLGQRDEGHWNITVFISTISIVLILLIGSLWIMGHLNYNMMPNEMETHLLREEGMSDVNMR